MDPEFWLDRWRTRNIAFDQAVPHPDLIRHWASLGLDAGEHAGTVLVPLCGKSIDMVWLAEQGHRVVGIELSRTAVEEFFADRMLEPEVTETDVGTWLRAGPYELVVGDFFDLTREALGDVEAVYDRASLVALPPPLRGDYVQHLDELSGGSPILLIGFDYDQAAADGPPFAVPVVEVRDLFGRRRVSVVGESEGLRRNPGMAARGVVSLSEISMVIR